MLKAKQKLLKWPEVRAGGEAVMQNYGVETLKRWQTASEKERRCVIIIIIIVESDAYKVINGITIEKFAEKFYLVNSSFTPESTLNLKLSLNDCIHVITWFLCPCPLVKRHISTDLYRLLCVCLSRGTIEAKRAWCIDFLVVLERVHRVCPVFVAGSLGERCPYCMFVSCKCLRSRSELQNFRE